jgi:thiol-disulfide isomerase/thioredoxin
MKKFIILILCILIGQGVFSQSQKAAQRFLQKVDKALGKREAHSYKATLTIKESLVVDTFSMEGKVYLLKNAKDRFFGYNLWIETDLFSSFYLQGKYYMIDNINRKIYPGKFLDPKKVDRQKGPFFRSKSDKLFDEFLHPDSAFYRLSQDPSYVLEIERNGFCSNTIIVRARNISGRVVKNIDTLSGFLIEMEFDRKTKMPLRISRKGLGAWSNFYHSIEFQHEELSNDTLFNFFNEFLLNTDFEIIQPKVDKKVDDSKPNYNKALPTIHLNDYKGKSYKLEDYQGQVILLDFWYSSCAPCIKASPFVDKLKNKYEEAGLLVLGMNPVDKVPRVERHYNRHGMSYNTLMCTREARIALDVSSYPTFIIVDKSGRIVHKVTGFSPAIMNNLEKIIQSYLKEEN